MSWLIAGLGNIGPKYRFTRHNIGFMVLDQIAKQFGVEFKEDRKISGRVAKVQSNEQTILLIKPSTFMNLSGECVHKALNFYKTTDRHLVVIYDDAALPFKTFRIREKGSAGGHNGLKSIEQSLQKQEYLRLRMGVGEKLEGQDLADYVLAPFTDLEQAELPSFINLGAKVALRLTSEPIARVMNEVN